MSINVPLVDSGIKTTRLLIPRLYVLFKDEVVNS